MKKSRRSLCPISFSLDIIGDKWSLLILRDILFYGRVRYSDFARSDERMATNILADRLDRLVREGILRKRRDRRLRNQYIYTTTAKGDDLVPLLVEMVLWGVKYNRRTGGKFAARVRKDRHALAAEILAAVRAGRFTEFRDSGRLPR